MDRHFAEFLEELGSQVDYWVKETSSMVRDPAGVGPLSPVEQSAFQTLGHVLGTDDDVNSAFQAVLFYTMTGLLHSVMAALDGATQLADSFTLTLTTSDGHQLAPGTGLNELLVEHLYETGRLPSSTE